VTLTRRIKFWFRLTFIHHSRYWLDTCCWCFHDFFCNALAVTVAAFQCNKFIFWEHQLKGIFVIHRILALLGFPFPWRNYPLRFIIRVYTTSPYLLLFWNRSKSRTGVMLNEPANTGCCSSSHSPVVYPLFFSYHAVHCMKFECW